MRKTLGVCLLVLLLTTPAAAGEIPNDKPAPPPSDPATTMQEPIDGLMFQGELATSSESESLTQITLELLAILPSIL